MKLYLASLGCARNLVDSEVMLGRLKRSGWTVTEDPAEAGRRLRRFTFIAAGTYDLAAKIAIELARS